MRLIDGDALIDKYGEWYVEDLTNYLEIGYIGTIKRIVDSMPTIEPERAIKDCRNCKHGNYNDHWDTYFCYYSGDCNDWDKWEPSAEPERLTDDDFETIRIHLNAYKEKLCNQRRWEEAEEYQHIIDRLMVFASAQLEHKKGKWELHTDERFDIDYYKCSKCGYEPYRKMDISNFCPNCGCQMEEGEK